MTLARTVQVVVSSVRVERVTSPAAPRVSVVTSPAPARVDRVQTAAPAQVVLAGLTGPQGRDGSVAATLPYASITDKPTSFAPATYSHVQSVASAVWTIRHNLGRYPQVTVLDSAFEEVISTIQYPDANTVLVIAGAPTTGRAELI